MANIVTRPLAEQDFDAWRRLWTDYLAFYNTAVAEKVYHVTWERLLSDRANTFAGFVAETPDRGAVGLTHFLFHRHCWREEDVCYLQDLYVTPAARGIGAGRALIETVYHKADSQGAPNVYWLTQASNIEARRLYDRIGSPTDFMRYNRF